MDKEIKKVIVGMSGGVDSTMVAAFLKKEGFEVQGIFLEFWRDEKSEAGFKSAKKMADALKIPLFKVNAEDAFKKKVVDGFVKEYGLGNTPNPCVICNPKMKFDILLKEMEERGADFVATGHYANIKNGRLFSAKDKSKDQGYFLYGLRSDQLKKIIFPLGKYLKSEVKKLAREMGLEVVDREESQDVCFIAQNNFEGFLRERIKDNPGEIKDLSGKVLGQHKGLHFYTIGQRKGINLGGDGPYYVIEKDMKNNILIVSNKESDLLGRRFLIRGANWISKDLVFPLNAEVRLRYHSVPARATIKALKQKNIKTIKQFEIELEIPQKAITSGQSAVFYKGGEVLGGGIIV